jgi:hypothetical protein
MKYHTWIAEKNAWLKATRGLCFEEVVLAIEARELLDVIDRPNQVKYPYQKTYVLTLNDYVHLVPFVEDADTVFLKTIIPSRQANASYLNKATP